MKQESNIDCILIGYNDPNFEEFVEKQKVMQDRSGAYHEIKTNSIVFNRTRIQYMDLINDCISKAKGQNPNFHVFETAPLGVCYLQSYLKKRGFNTDIIPFFNRGKEKLKNLLSTNPKAAVISTTFYVEEMPILPIVEFIKKHGPNTKIIIGGPHIYKTDALADKETKKYVFEKIGADIYIIDSQGENTLSRVLDKLDNNRDLNNIPNLYYKDENNEFKRTQTVIEQNDLNKECIDWNHIDPDIARPISYVRTVRGCPFNCAFCNFHSMVKEHTLKSIDTVEKELKALHDIGVKHIVFIDDTLNVPLSRFKKMLNMMIKNRFDFRWSSFFRPSNADEEAIDLMRQSGCFGVFMGIESGDPGILKNMNKSADVQRYRKIIPLLNKNDILTYASLICGFPGETEASVKNTIALIDEAAPTFFNVQLYYHDLNTPIHKRAEEFGIKGAGYSWQHNSMDWKQATKLAEYMVRNIHNSMPAPLYNFSLWGIAYLAARGITASQIKDLTFITRDMLLSSFDEEESARGEESKIIYLFSDGKQELSQSQIKELKKRIADEKYWFDKLADIKTHLVLPYDLSNTLQKEFKPDKKDIEFAQDLTDALLKMAVNHNIDVSDLILSIFILLLLNLTKQNDLCIGICGLKKDSEKSSGLFPIAININTDLDFEELVAMVTESKKSLLDHLKYPADGLIKKFKEKVSDKKTLFNVVYCYGENKEKYLDPLYKYDIALSYKIQNKKLILSLNYDSKLFLPATADKYLSTIKDYAEAVLQAG